MVRDWGPARADGFAARGFAAGWIGAVGGGLFRGMPIQRRRLGAVSSSRASKVQ